MDLWGVGCGMWVWCVVGWVSVGLPELDGSSREHVSVPGGLACVLPDYHIHTIILSY